MHLCGIGGLIGGGNADDLRDSKGFSDAFKGRDEESLRVDAEQGFGGHCDCRLSEFLALNAGNQDGVADGRVDHAAMNDCEAEDEDIDAVSQEVESNLAFVMAGKSGREIDSKGVALISYFKEAEFTVKELAESGWGEVRLQKAVMVQVGGGSLRDGE